ncbi:MAG: MFS transporter [Bacteroidota bacterium]|nr:MFS transporter [Bacteroidota bacterium]MDX5430085.1 MFS transporter [Bacteroidota bacterium]MDX5468849.1 MFS transporter [Bacteroidota bacterium]
MMRILTKTSLLNDRSFQRLCACSLLFFASFNMIIPELPDYLRSLGGEKYIGHIIFLFTITALLSRPFSGKWADAIGRVPIIVFGAAVSALCGLLYLFTTSVFWFLALRLFHGFSTGFTPTGTSAYVADIVPVKRRGEAMGILSLAGSVGMAMGPAFGSYLTLKFGYEALFMTSSLSGIAAVLWMMGLKEPLQHPVKFNSSMFRIRFHEFYEPRVLMPSLVMVLVVFSFGTMITLIPDRCKELGLENRGLFFTVFTAASVLVRFGAGKISDRLGREKVLLVSSLLIALAMFVLGNASSLPLLFLGSVLFGLGNGINSPTIMAWSIDLSDIKYVGRAMATVYMALEIGIGGGAFLSGWAYTTNTHWYSSIFIACSILCLLAFVILLNRIRLKS